MLYIVTVIPIRKGLGKEQLSYFGSTLFPLGSVISVPLRGRTIPALVIAVREGENEKTDLKRARFALRKIKGSTSKKLFSDAFIRAVMLLKERYVSHTGELLLSLTPAFVLQQFFELITKEPSSTDDRVLPPVESPERLTLPTAIQAASDERFFAYRNTIRETFARGKSVFLLIPTRADLDRVHPILARGIEQYVFRLHSSLPVRELLTAWQMASVSIHPVLVMGTGHYLSLPRNDWGAFIIESEHRRSYKSVEHPSIDFRIAAELLANTCGAATIFGDTLLSIEAHYRLQKGLLVEGGTFRQRLTLPVFPELLDQRQQGTLARGIYGSEFFSKSALQLIQDCGLREKKVLLFTVRRGIAPITICNDCSTLLACPRCTTPLVLTRSSGNLTGLLTKELLASFACPRCEFVTETSMSCAHCQGWRLTPLGFGADRITELVKELFPDRAVFHLSGDTAKTMKQAQNIAEAFAKEPSGILVGTEMTLSTLREPVYATIVVSIDALFTIPDYRMHERIYSLIIDLAERTQEKFLIQTRRIKEPLWKEIRELRSNSFYRSELQERARFGYPPTTVLIKIRWQGSKANLGSTEKYIEELLSPYEPVFVPMQTIKKTGEERIVVLLRVPRSAWAKNDSVVSKHVLSEETRALYARLPELLSALPREYSIEIDPEDLMA